MRINDSGYFSRREIPFAYLFELPQSIERFACLRPEKSKSTTILKLRFKREARLHAFTCSRYLRMFVEIRGAKCGLWTFGTRLTLISVIVIET